MIEQESDLGYFINAKDSADEKIYALGLGVIGSLAMKEIADNIQTFIDNIESELD